MKINQKSRNILIFLISVSFFLLISSSLFSCCAGTGPCGGTGGTMRRGVHFAIFTEEKPMTNFSATFIREHTDNELKNYSIDDNEVVFTFEVRKNLNNELKRYNIHPYEHIMIDDSGIISETKNEFELINKHLDFSKKIYRTEVGYGYYPSQHSEESRDHTLKLEIKNSFNLNKIVVLYQKRESPGYKYLGTFKNLKSFTTDDFLLY